MSTKAEALESLEAISRFYTAVTDYFRDGQPSRLMPNIYDLGMPTARALEALRTYVQDGEMSDGATT
jgi:hypothetical protein